MGCRRIDPEPVPADVIDDYADAVRCLASIPEAFEGGPHRLRLSPEAENHFRAWRATVEAMLGDNGRLEPMRDWGGKLEGLTDRLAAVLHLVSSDLSDAVGAESMGAAIELARWSISHAEAAVGLMVGSAAGPWTMRVTSCDGCVSVACRK
jgi:hypothetical protein